MAYPFGAFFGATCRPVSSNPVSQLSSPIRPPGRSWLHEVKHDGFRILGARKAGRTASRCGVAAALCSGTGFQGSRRRWAGLLPVDNALIDGEAVVFLPDGHSDFAGLLTKAVAAS